MPITKGHAVFVIIFFFLIDLATPFWPFGSTMLLLCLFIRSLRRWLIHILMTLDGKNVDEENCFGKTRKP